MLVLGIDTATSVLSVAILEEEKILSAYTADSKRNHSGLLLSVIESQLKKNKLGLTDIRLIAVSKGPGSFTGLRVGISLSKGFAFSLNIPLIGIPTLDALAINRDTSHFVPWTIPYFICPLLDAKKNQIYCALYKNVNSKLKRMTEYLSVEFKELCNTIKKIAGKSKILFTGEGVSAYRTELKDAFKESAVFDDSKSIVAVSVAKIGTERFKNGISDSIYGLSPLYIRKPDVREH